MGKQAGKEKSFAQERDGGERAGRVREAVIARAIERGHLICLEGEALCAENYDCEWDGWCEQESEKGLAQRLPPAQREEGVFCWVRVSLEKTR